MAMLQPSTKPVLFTMPVLTLMMMILPSALQCGLTLV